MSSLTPHHSKPLPPQLTLWAKQQQEGSVVWIECPVHEQAAVGKAQACCSYQGVQDAGRPLHPHTHKGRAVHLQTWHVTHMMAVSSARHTTYGQQCPSFAQLRATSAGHTDSLHSKALQKARRS